MKRAFTGDDSKRGMSSSASEVNDPATSWGAQNKRPKTDRVQLRLLIPTKAAGSLIGKGGANIRSLRDDPLCSVRVPDCPGPERVFSISHVDMQAVVNVTNRALYFMTEESIARGSGNTSAAVAAGTAANNSQGGGPGGPDDRSAIDKEPDEQFIEVRILVNQSIVGSIIGRGGDKIKNVRDVSGANVRVFALCAPQSTDRAVSVRGTVGKVKQAIQMLAKDIAEGEIKGPDNHYDPINFDGYYADKYGGWGTQSDVDNFAAQQGGQMNGSGGGRQRGSGHDNGDMRSGGGGRYGGGGGPMGDGMRGGGPSMNYPPPMRAGGSGGRGLPRGVGQGTGIYHDAGVGGGYRAAGGGIGGGGGVGAVARAALAAPGMGGAAAAAYMGPAGGAPSHHMTAAAAPAAVAVGAALAASSGPREETAVTISKEMGGAIIGPAGSRIRRIRNDSQAGINIGDPIPGTEQRVVTITGTKEQIQMAQYLMQMCVKENASMGGHGGGGGGHGGHGGPAGYGGGHYGSPGGGGNGGMGGNGVGGPNNRSRIYG